MVTSISRYEKNAIEQEFRQQCLQAFIGHKGLENTFNAVKAIALGNNQND